MRRYIKFTSLFAFSLFFAFTSCKKDEGCTIHPEPFRFSIVESGSGTDLIESGEYQVENIEIYYFFNDEKQDLIVILEENPEGDLTELFSAQLPMISLSRTETFYLQLSQQETDTLLVVMGKETRDGCIYHPYETVFHNGTNLPIPEEGKAFILEK
jgi:hypothetical protein